MRGGLVLLGGSGWGRWGGLGLKGGGKEEGIKTGRERENGYCVDFFLLFGILFYP